MTGQLQGKIALITGASKGIGAAAAKSLASEGAHVILVARSIPRLEEIDDEISVFNGSTTLVPCDLTDPQVAEQMSKYVAERFGRVDILVGNAGTLGSLTPIAHVDEKLWDDTFDLNTKVNQRLIACFDPLLRASSAGRAIFLTTSTDHSYTPYWGVYSASKAALNVLVKTYAAEMKNTPVRINLLDPGPVRTDMLAKAMPGKEPVGTKDPSALHDLFIKLSHESLTETGEIFKA